ncbi:MAG TPA: hypothetical protein VGQ66_02870 [Candidatus Limnocylindria bacterium]|nr:hypothetical protein [Candidatus Limnocylindria bacterium]
MIKSLVRTLRGPSRDPRMAFISLPLPRNLRDEQVLAALEIALTDNPNPDDLVESLPGALRQVTGHTYQVLDRAASDVTGSFRRSQVMIRDGAVGLWPGYAARAYPMLAPSKHAERTRAAILAADGSPADAPGPTNPVGKPEWAPPPAVRRDAEAGHEPTDEPTDEGG